MQGHEHIDIIYAFIVTDEDNTEGIPAYMAPNGMMMPMIGADLERVESLREVAEDIALDRGVIITLAKFEQRTDLERFAPDNQDVERGNGSGN